MARPDDQLLATISAHAVSLLRIARQHSLCADDAQDAYQRALEIYLERLDRVDPATAPSAHEPDHSPLDAVDDTGEQQQQQQQQAFRFEGAAAPEPRKLLRNGIGRGPSC